ncbi:hypothetical protein E2P81_ATG06721 [Venturia nashicola]|uniref:Uncharacterized protein n=1 Tax=Venturia nashicola TaxID=86259 RepID=A0A4Z1P5C0_9PEZI|nr:hypothetical protein E6O75_ATG06891 [Venturia nashicola]TLD30068.1 hypothetical protein E2P81_ATG06721 [Venturia nashicola]
MTSSLGTKSINCLTDRQGDVTQLRKNLIRSLELKHGQYSPTFLSASNRAARLARGYSTMLSSGQLTNSKPLPRTSLEHPKNNLGHDSASHIPHQNDQTKK